ncbi:hypothetical protein niasHT_017992 [Heterodera trifolii]|uniref:Nuclear receptor domain-containing protein n=1 Tax=Heterodera trifolii TaxID=157864 RepID=A0ABD2LBM4_9BILA
MRNGRIGTKQDEAHSVDEAHDHVSCVAGGAHHDEVNYGDGILTDKVKCHGCRLDKCLVAGMDPTLINVPHSDKFKQFLANLKKCKMSAMLTHSKI